LYFITTKQFLNVLSRYNITYLRFSAISQFHFTLLLLVISSGVNIRLTKANLSKSETFVACISYRQRPHAQT